MRIIEEYQKLIEQIAAIKSEIARSERYLQRLIDIYKPADIKAIEYSQEPVHGSPAEHDIVEVAKKIIQLQHEIAYLEQELSELHKQRKELENTVNSLGDIEKQIIMHRMRDPRIPVWKLAKLIHVSERTVTRRLKEIREDEKWRNLA